MKDWEDIIKERLAGRKAELPESDWNDFLSRKAAHDLSVRRRHRILAAAISIPATAAVVPLLVLVPFNTVVPDNQMSQNEPSEQPIISDSLDVNSVDSIMIPANQEPEKAVIKEPKPVKTIYAQVKQPEPQLEIVETPQELHIEQLVAQNDFAVSAGVGSVQMLNDTARFNSAAYKLPDGASAEDLIRKLPGVEIADDGTITVNGKAVQRILVNGKEFFNEEKSVELKQLTADMIEKVKAYDKQSDLSRQTGIDDGLEETVHDLHREVSIIDSIYISDTLFYRKGTVRVPIRKSKLSNIKDHLLELPGVQVYDDGNVTVDGVNAKKIVFKGNESIKIICSKRYSVVYLPFSTH